MSYMYDSEFEYLENTSIHCVTFPNTAELIDIKTLDPGPLFCNNIFSDRYLI